MQHTRTRVRAHTFCMGTACAPQYTCSTPAAPLQRPCSTPAAPLKRPCSTRVLRCMPGCAAWSQAPSVPENIFSNELAEFVSLCLNKNEIKRPSANDLLKHHWLRKHPTDDMLLSASLEKMML